MPAEIKDIRTKYVPVGCGKCMECMKQKSRTWNVRLNEEIRTDNTGIFVTLTFSNEQIDHIANGRDTEGKLISKPINLLGYDLDNEIAKIAVRRFLERWRKKYKKSVKHWLVTEIGGHNSENIHLHGIVFTKYKNDITNIWQYGYVFTGDYVSEKTISYITKYITKTDIKHKNYTQIILTSPGIGSNYLKRRDSKNNKYTGNNTKETYTNRQGYKINLPIYYRNKIYTDDEKEQLWLNKLDQNTRYVNGIKIDVSKTDEIYYKVLKDEQLKNEKLGYGTEKKNWDKIKYEHQKRNLKIKERIEKANALRLLK